MTGCGILVNFISAVSLFLVIFTVLVYTSDVNMDYYLVCKDHYAASRIRETKIENRRIACSFYCGRHYWCRAVTIYSYGSSVECHYHDGIYDVDGCNSFPADINIQLLLKKEEYVMPFENGCYNGGTWSGSKCNCVYGFAGNLCERYLRDCMEGKDVGLDNIGGHNPVMIKPTGSEFAFETLCYFAVGSVVAIKRIPNVHNIQFNRSWNEYKYAFGSASNFWMGLEVMYRVINQPGAVFKLHVWCMDLNSVQVGTYYLPFKVAPESLDYAVTTGAVTGTPGSDGIGANMASIPFCVYDRPCSGFPGSNDGGWWYIPLKADYALTSPYGSIHWLHNNAEFNANMVAVGLIRVAG